MKSLLALVFAALIGASCAAHGGGLLTVDVIDRDSGATLPTYEHDGKLYIVGVPGQRYGVRLTNRTAMRLLAVLSVDGVNAISGETADTEQSGYVLDGFASTEVNGWRKSLSEVAQFNFTRLSDSYAARTGRPMNVGVIGVAVYREKPLFWREGRIAEAPLADRYPPAPPAAQSKPAPRAEPQRAGERARDGITATTQNKAVAEEALGTGHGAREHSEVRYTKFVRAQAQPDEIDAVWYDSFANLQARGVIAVTHAVKRDPRPFPGSFVPDPR